MGLFDFLRTQFIEVIEWDSQEPEMMLWRFPDVEHDIKYGAQLIVRDSQNAVFMNEGEIGDTYRPGRHELVTENMPIITKLKSWKYAFESPFKVDVFYTSTRTFPNLKWGTQQPIMMRDPEFKQVRLQAFGVYMVRISEPAKFVREFAGIANEVYIQDVEERLRGMVMGKFAEATAEAGVSVLDLATNYSEIGAKIKPVLQSLFEPFGMEIVDFQISSTTLPPEVTAFYDKMTNMNMVDNMQRFQQFQAANAIEESAKNGGSDGGNIASSLATAQLMMNQMNQQQINPTAQPVNKEDIMNTLKQLADLKTAGVITEEEFNAKKKELLEKL